VGLYLAQLPPAELARLKAELAETLIANFCYPRFLDYRTSTLRMRPVDRAKRQEVWSFLSSYDFSSWGRVDIQSPDFHRLVERLLIQYIQRNRAFFGNQGRKRMPDVRALIGTSAIYVTDGLRGHLTGQPATQAAHSFGSPRPVISWSSSTQAADLSWEQIASATQQLQQQLQEARGEIQAESEPPTRSIPASPAPYASPARPASTQVTPPRRSPRNRAGANGSGKVQAVVPPKSSIPPLPPVPPAPSTTPTSPAKSDRPAARASNPHASPPASDAMQAAPAPSLSSSFSPPQPALPPTPALDHSAPPLRSTPGPVEEIETLPFSEGQPPSISGAHGNIAPLPVRQSQAAEPPPLQAPPPSPTSMRELSRSPSTSLPAVMGSQGTPAKAAEQATVMLSDEDLVIFDQLKYQLVVWLRVEAVRQGLDIANQSPLQLIDLLRQQGEVDETRLQVVTTLLQIADAVAARGQAALIDYKQAMMFYLMHTRRAR
jgi:hypothetical protein